MAEIQLQPINGEQQVDIGGEPEVARWWHRPYYVAAGIVLIVLVFSPLFGWVITLGAANYQNDSAYIVGGQPGNLPYAVSVQRYGRYRCSGTLVDKQYVYLPAQCVDKINPMTLTVQLGRKTLDEEGSVRRFVTVFQVDPVWSGGRWWSNDQALLKMDRPVDYAEDIQPACLAGEGSVFAAGTEASVCGGFPCHVGQGKPLPKPRTLQCVNVTVTPHGLCKQIYQEKVDDDMICAGNMAGSQDVCRGDAGAALMFKQGDDWIMGGQVIRGPKECGAPNMPTVYWKPSKEFITTAIEEMRDPLPPCGTRPVLGPAVESAVGRIIGGHVAIPHSWPWMAYFMWRGVNDPDPNSATLIHESFVLTHHKISPGDVMVFGAHSRLHSEHIQKIKVEEVFRQPNCNPHYQRYCIVLAKLSSPVKFNKHVQPLCLPDADDFSPAGKTCMITGWGETYQGGPTSVDPLCEAYVTIITQEQCKRDIWMPGYINSNINFCTARSGSTTWDVGGPLMCENDDGSWTLYGVNSYAGYYYYPSVYHKVTPLLPWINPIIEEYEATRHQVCFKRFDG